MYLSPPLLGVAVRGTSTPRPSARLPLAAAADKASKQSHVPFCPRAAQRYTVAFNCFHQPTATLSLSTVLALADDDVRWWRFLWRLPRLRCWLRWLRWRPLLVAGPPAATPSYSPVRFVMTSSRFGDDAASKPSLAVSDMDGAGCWRSWLAGWLLAGWLG